MNRKTTLTLIATLGLALTAGAAADIGFPASVQLCRNALPGKTLIEVVKRVRQGTLVYEGALYNPANLTTQWEARFRASDGLNMGLDTGATSSNDLSEVQAIMANISQVQLDFADALTIAQAEQPTGVANKMELDFEEGILSYKVLFNDSAFRVYVDAATGGIVPQHQPGDDTGDLATPEQLTASMDAVFASNGLLILGAEGEDESGVDNNTATVVEVSQWNASTGMIMVTDVDAATGTLGNQVSFLPSASQLQKINRVLALVDTATVTWADAISQTAAQFPGAGIHEAELEGEDAGLVYKFEIITASGLEMDVFVDAFTSFAAAHAPIQPIVGDGNNDGVVDGTDLGELLSMWGSANPAFDFDGDGVVAGPDLGVLLGNWTL